MFEDSCLNSVFVLPSSRCKGSNISWRPIESTTNTPTKWKIGIPEKPKLADFPLNSLILTHPVKCNNSTKASCTTKKEKAIAGMVMPNVAFSPPGML